MRMTRQMALGTVTTVTWCRVTRAGEMPQDTVRAEEEVAQEGDRGRQSKSHTYAQAMESAKARAVCRGKHLWGPWWSQHRSQTHCVVCTHRISGTRSVGHRLSELLGLPNNRRHRSSDEIMETAVGKHVHGLPEGRELRRWTFPCSREWAGLEG